MKSIAACLALLFAAGCALKPDVPGSMKPHMPGSWKAARSQGQVLVSTSWPATFGSRELAALARQALAGNKDLAAATARVLQADAQARIAGAALYPQVTGSADASRSLNPGTLRSKSAPFRASVSARYGLGITASYALDFWGRNASLAEAARLSAEATAFDYDTLAISTLAAVTNSYFQILLAQERLRIARDNIRGANQILSAIKARVEVGTGNALDVAQQESVIANLRANVPALQQQLQQSRNLLAVLLGRTPQAARIRGGSLRALKLPQVKAGLPSQLLLRRPDIAAAEMRLESAGASILAARAALYPSISLTGNLGLESISLRNLLRPEALAASLAGGLVQSIFSGYSLESQVDQSRARRLELLAAYRKSILEALADVENALVAVRKTAEQESLRAVTVAAARRASQITAQRLREGTIDVVTLLNTQQTLFNAQDALTLARFERLQAIVSLYQALGGGFVRETRDMGKPIKKIADGAARPVPAPKEDGP